MNKRSRSSLVSPPITCWSVTHSVLTPRGIKYPQHKKTVGAFRPLERGWHGTKQSESMAPCPLTGAARGATYPRRYSRPLPHRPGATAWCHREQRGGGGHAAGRGASACRCYTGVPSLAHDGTERRIVRPQDAVTQTECYSGKEKDHTVKNV